MTVSVIGNWQLMAWIVNWLIICLSQPEALGDGDGAVAGASVEGKPSGTLVWFAIEDSCWMKPKSVTLAFKRLVSKAGFGELTIFDF
jgi:hypothetical protein